LPTSFAIFLACKCDWIAWAYERERDTERERERDRGRERKRERARERERERARARERQREREIERQREREREGDLIDSRPVPFHLSIVLHVKNGRVWIPWGSLISVKSQSPHVNAQH